MSQVTATAGEVAAPPVTPIIVQDSGQPANGTSPNPAGASGAGTSAPGTPAPGTPASGTPASGTPGSGEGGGQAGRPQAPTTGSTGSESGNQTIDWAQLIGHVDNPTPVDTPDPVKPNQDGADAWQNQFNDLYGRTLQDVDQGRDPNFQPIDTSLSQQQAEDQGSFARLKERASRGENTEGEAAELEKRLLAKETLLAKSAERLTKNPAYRGTDGRLNPSISRLHEHLMAAKQRSALIRTDVNQMLNKDLSKRGKELKVLEMGAKEPALGESGSGHASAAKPGVVFKGTTGTGRALFAKPGGRAQAAGAESKPELAARAPEKAPASPKPGAAGNETVQDTGAEPLLLSEGPEASQSPSLGEGTTGDGAKPDQGGITHPSDEHLARVGAQVAQLRGEKPVDPERKTEDRARIAAVGRALFGAKEKLDTGQASEGELLAARNMEAGAGGVYRTDQRVDFARTLGGRSAQASGIVYMGGEGSVIREARGGREEVGQAIASANPLKIGPEDPNYSDQLARAGRLTGRSSTGFTPDEFGILSRFNGLAERGLRGRDLRRVDECRA